MELKGTVLNVVDFGAFVDIGLKDSGLVHISQMANRYIKSPYDVVAVGDVVTVWVLKVDKDRHRVSPDDDQARHRAGPRRENPKRRGRARPRKASAASIPNMAAKGHRAGQTTGTAGRPAGRTATARSWSASRPTTGPGTCR